MKAITQRNYGPPSVLQLEEVLKPIPKENEILIQIYATAVNSGDCRLRKPDPQLVRLVFGILKPRNPILGGTFAGRIEAIGDKVTKFKVGDRIYGMTGMNFGTYAEYKCLPESATIDFIPDSLTESEAAAIPFGSMTAYHFLTRCKMKEGDKVLIYGASGSVGSAAIQIAKAFGGEVTAVCSSANSEFVKSLGSKYVLNYDKKDFKLEQRSYDVIFDTVGFQLPAFFLPALKQDGALILCNASALQMLWAIGKPFFSNLKTYIGVSSEAVENLRALSHLIQEGKLKPVISQTFSLEQMVEAHTLVEGAHKKGNVVVQIV